VQSNQSWLIGVFGGKHGCVITDCELVSPQNVAQGHGVTPLVIGTDGGANNCIVRRCDISGGENGMQLEGTGILIEDNYIHDIIPYDAGLDPHVDAIQVFDHLGNGLTIRHNNVIANNDSSSCHTGQGTNMTYDNNRFIAGYVCFRFYDSPTNKITNNRFLKSTEPGAALFSAEGGGPGGIVFTNNVNDVNGAPVSIND